MFLILGFGIILSFIGVIVIGIYFLYKLGKRVWKEKKLDLNFIESIAFKFFYIVEDIMEPKREVKDSPVKYLLEIYDYIAVRTVDLENANRHLRRNAKNVLGSEDAIFYIKDCWNSPFGRLFSIVLEKEPGDVQHETIYPLEFLTAKINRMEEIKTKRTLRIVK